MTWTVGANGRREPDAYTYLDVTLGNGYTRRSLLNERAGHGRYVTGGMRGREVVVTATGATGAAQLQAALALTDPAWITFTPGLSGYLTPSTYLDAQANKTVDGRGAPGLMIENYPIRARGCNIIVNDMTVRYDRIWGGIDPLSVQDFEGPGHLEFGYPDYDLHQFWAHHCHFYGLQQAGGNATGWLDEGVNTPRRTKYVTVSWCHFHRLYKAHICGNNILSSDDAGDFVTWHHNYFDECEQRQPLLRFARNLHAYNNYWKNWGGLDGSHGQAIQNQMSSAILIENNVFDHPAAMASVYGGASTPGDHKHVGNLFGGLAFKPADLNPGNVPVPDYPYTPDTANQALRDALTGGVGPR